MIQWMDALIGLGIGLLVGVLLGVLGTTVRALKRRAELDVEVSNARERAGLLAEQIEARDRDEHRLRDAFKALSTDALRGNNEQFMQLVKPVRELLDKQGRTLEDLEQRRQKAYGSLETQVKGLAEASDRLSKALRRPEQRGRWGEMQLRNAVELAGMTEHCDFTEQPQTDDPNTRDRPDMIVHMPGDARIVVDSKVALDAYLDAGESEVDRDAALKRHAELVETHYRKLSAKKYWDQFEHTPKLVVMFMPLESALVAALDLKPELHATAMRNNVLIATPTLLVGMLRAIAYGWQQEAVADNARQIAECGRELYDRLSKFVEHFEKVGTALQTAGVAYDDAIGSLESRLLPSARKLKELKATTAGDIDPPPAIKAEPRPVVSAELKPEGHEPSLSDFAGN